MKDEQHRTEVMRRGQVDPRGLTAWLALHAHKSQATGLTAVHKTAEGETPIAHWTIDEVRARLDDLGAEIIGLLQGATEDADQQSTFWVQFLRDGDAPWMARRIKLRPFGFDERRDFDGSYLAQLQQSQRHNEMLTKALVDLATKTSAQLHQHAQTQFAQLDERSKLQARMEMEADKLRRENARLSAQIEYGGADDDASGSMVEELVRAVAPQLIRAVAARAAAPPPPAPTKPRQVPKPAPPPPAGAQPAAVNGTPKATPS